MQRRLVKVFSTALFVLCLALLSSPPVLAVEEWPIEVMPSDQAHYEAAVAAILKGESYDTDSQGGQVLRPFLVASKHWDVFIPHLIQRVRDVSSGAAELLEIPAENAKGAVQGMAAIFHLNVASKEGPKSYLVILTQSGIITEASQSSGPSDCSRLL